RGDFRRPREVRPDASPALEAVCLKAMALMPADRYRSVRQFAEDIEHWLADEPVGAYRDSLWERARRFASHHTAAAAAIAYFFVLDIALLAIAGYLAYQRYALGPEAQTGVTSQALETIRTAGAHLFNIILSTSIGAQLGTII